MKEKINAYTNKTIYIVLTVLFFVFALFFFCWKQNIFEFEFAIISDKFGQFGDFFGGVLGTIFALISVLFLINTLVEQRKVTLENKKLVETQRFNDLFFELLNIYQEQTKELQDKETKLIKEDNTDYIKTIEYNNKDFFDYNKIKCQESFNPQTSFVKNLKESKKIYSLFYLKNKSKLAIYYRTLYRIFDLIEKSELLDDASKKVYAKIIRAQLTESELFFLRYNSLTYYGENFIQYINRYNVLKHLPHFELLEFKSWWIELNAEERIGIDMLFFCINDLIKCFNNQLNAERKQVPIASVKYALYIVKVSKANICIELKIKNDKENTTEEYRGLDKFSHERIQALFDCIIKEIVKYSNFERYNTNKELTFYPSPIVTSNRITLIQSGVRNNLGNPIILRKINRT